MTSDFLGQKFTAGLIYPDYVATGNPEQHRRWAAVYELATLTPDQRSLIGSFTRQMKLLVVSGIWCGDCVQQVPLLAKIAEANPANVQLRVIDRDQHKDLSKEVEICGGGRVPTVLFLAEDDTLCGLYGDRTLSRYRAIAQRQIGAACATGIVAPAGDEIAAAMQDWVNEVERIQLMLRFSPRLRQKHND